LQRLIDGSYEPLPNYYGTQTYFVRKAMAYRNPVVGWLAIGNSASFTNLPISPGMNAGIVGAIYAATLIQNIFAAPSSDRLPVLRRCPQLQQTHTYT